MTNMKLIGIVLLTEGYIGIPKKGSYEFIHSDDNLVEFTGRTVSLLKIVYKCPDAADLVKLIPVDKIEMFIYKEVSDGN